ncbi:PAS domain S-box protein [Methanonatronarchaeum sp. AMET-Sl]|uniref:hybrid sensor histidine kinase/response regulator n=1 Tax=Methanonatronarchaeum sp. AMET-Sl TaxID=3037654 RepID=UPI00244E2FE3|nr:PAS domain S-box protein [Methanonatronarchaeum sp. AMET-Sl]WGI18013.1 PAS domain S-box protein [Methanonatronarchaeum sp. AMET-Sl]
MWVLVVDDEAGFLDLASTYLSNIDERFDVDTALSPEEKLGEIEKYDCIVSDYQMPDIDGLEFLGTVRNELDNDVPFIMLTGKGREEIAMEALNLGANRYIQKGGDPKSQFEELAHAIIQEIEHHNTKKKVKKKEERYRRLFETAYDGMLIMDAETGEIKDANPHIQELTGYSKEELVGKKLWQLGTFKDIVENKKRFEKLVEQGYARYEDLPLKTKNGEKNWVEFISNTYQVGGEKVIQSNIRDITDRKKSEQQTQERLKELDLLYSLSKLETKHRSIDKILDKTVNLWPDALQHPEDACARIKYRNQEYKTDNFQETEWSLKNKITLEGEEKGFVQICYLNQKPEADKGPFLKEEEKILNEFTDRLARILEKNKIREREEFLHSLLRHDVRNKTQISTGYLERLKDYKLPEEAEEYVEKSGKAVKDIIDLIEKLKTLSEIKEKEELEEINIHSIIEKIIGERTSQASEKGIEIEYGGLDCQVQGGSLLEELFSNLLENSIKHADCQKIQISGKQTNGECVVTIEDDGRGIPEEKKDRIFEKGFKSGITSGSGFGLYLVKEIAEKYSGSIKIKDSELGGARFDVVLQKA